MFALPVPLPMAIATFFTMWWTVLFAVLPFGVTSQEESGTVVPGTDRGAPLAPRLLWKALWTTIISIVLFVALMIIIAVTQSN
jgi:predicted secreted protein